MMEIEFDQYAEFTIVDVDDKTGQRGESKRFHVVMGDKFRFPSLTMMTQHTLWDVGRGRVYVFEEK